MRAGELCEAEVERLASLDEAYEAVRQAIWDEKHADWEKEERDAHLVVLAEHQARRRIRPAANGPQARHVGKPSKATVRRWWELWDAADGDIRVLISNEHRRGNRNAHYGEASEDGTTTYRLMAWAIDEKYLTDRRPNAKAVYARVYKPKCEEYKLPWVSYKTFRLFIRAKHTVYEVFRKRYGNRAAKLRFKIFERTRTPDVPLEEVEVDHCLIDLVVKHPITGRKLGRPWLTVLIDRATRGILGCHLSFEVPSYASLQRAMAHAFWRKDVSGIEGIEGEWPMHGVPVWIFTDNGRELRSDSLRLTEAMLDFGVVNLPAKQPEFKGMVERLFGSSASRSGRSRRGARWRAPRTTTRSNGLSSRLPRSTRSSSSGLSTNTTMSPIPRSAGRRLSRLGSRRPRCTPCGPCRSSTTSSA